MEKKSFYITTTLPYVNATPHVGFAMELIRADVIARYKKLMGYEVFFNTGTDEHGQKLVTSALAEGVDVKSYVDKNAETFKKLIPSLAVMFNFTVSPRETINVEGEKTLFAIVASNVRNFSFVCERATTTETGMATDGDCPVAPGSGTMILFVSAFFANSGICLLANSFSFSVYA
jgi:hypothetical protein